MRKNLCRSIELPLEEQYGENHGWENGSECYRYDTESVDKDHFEEMDFNELVRKVRKMENFMEERGVSVWFFRNYALADQVFTEKARELEGQYDSDTY